MRNRIAVLVALATVVALSLVASAQALDVGGRWKSPTGNIRCEYRTGAGVTCVAGRQWMTVQLFSRGRVYVYAGDCGSRVCAPIAMLTSLRDRWPTIPHGRVIKVAGRWRIASAVSGVTVWDIYTGHGFSMDGRSTDVFPDSARQD